MRHARAWACDAYPGASVQEAQKALRWIPTGKPLCVRCHAPPTRPMTVAEDLHGVFDLEILGATELVLVQVTTHDPSGGGNVSHRKRKIERWIVEHPIPIYAQVLLLAWQRASHFRAWQWQRRRCEWGPCFALYSPLVSSTRRS